MAYATFDGYEIPRVYDVQIERNLVGESARTAGGKLRQDVVAVKRSWTLSCRPVPKNKVDPLLNHLESTLYAEGAFWMQGLGTVTARISPDGIDERVVACAGEDGTWHIDGRELTITVEEV